MHALFATLGSVIGLSFLIPYIRGMLRGTVRPARMTWFLGTALACINFAAVFSFDAGYLLYPLACAALGKGIIFLCSLRYGVGGATRLDLICLAGAVVSVFFARFYSDPTLALMGSVLLAWFMLAPTLVNAWRHPERESRSAWMLAVAGNLCTLLSSETLAWRVVLAPANALVQSFAMALLVWMPARPRSDS
jgi:hypothetical protein